MSTPLEQQQSAARAARRRAERASSQGVAVDEADAPPLQHFIDQHETEQQILRDHFEAAAKDEQEEHEMRVEAGKKAAETRKENDKADEKGGSK